MMAGRSLISNKFMANYQMFAVNLGTAHARRIVCKTRSENYYI